MRTAIIFFFSLTIMAFAEDNPAAQVKRIASVGWDLQTGKLTWVVQTGTEGKYGFVASSEEHYEISPENAMMTSQGQERRFTSEEGTWLKNLLHILTAYCVESTIWWYHPEATPTPDGGTSSPAQPDQPKAKPVQDTSPSPVKVLDKKPPVVPRVMQASGSAASNTLGGIR